MDFNMKVGERLRVLKGFIEVLQVDGGARYYNVKGKLLSKFSKGEFKTTDLDVYENYVVIRNDKEMKLYDTEIRKFIGESFDEIWRWGETFVLKKDRMYYLYNLENKEMECKFKFYSSLNKRGFIVLYYNNKCGLWIKKDFPEEFFNVLPIEYQKIKVLDDEIITIKNGEEEHYPLEIVEKKEKEYYADTVNKYFKMQPYYQINFLNSISVSFEEQLILNEKFILVIRDLKEKRPCKYYNFQGKYIGCSGIIKDDSEYVCGENYVATENMLALGGEEIVPFGRSHDWKLYDYEGNELFGGSFKFEKGGKYYLATPSSCVENITYIFSDKGKLLFTLDNSKKILNVSNEYFEILDNENQIWFFDDKGKAIFDKGIKKDMMVRFYNGLVGEKIGNGYNVYDCNHGKIYYIKANSLENMDVCELNIFRVIYKEKQGGILLNSEGAKIIVPVKYLEVKKHDEFILAKAEEWDDIFSLDGTLIMSTK